MIGWWEGVGHMPRRRCGVWTGVEKLAGFPSALPTEGMRLTDAADCGGSVSALIFFFAQAEGLFGNEQIENT